MGNAKDAVESTGEGLGKAAGEGLKKLIEFMSDPARASALLSGSLEGAIVGCKNVIAGEINPEPEAEAALSGTEALGFDLREKAAPSWDASGDQLKKGSPGEGSQTPTANPNESVDQSETLNETPDVNQNEIASSTPRFTPNLPGKT